jgi:hypothetical protein
MTIWIPSWNPRWRGRGRFGWADDRWPRQRTSLARARDSHPHAAPTSWRRHLHPWALPRLGRKLAPLDAEFPFEPPEIGGVPLRGHRTTRCCGSRTIQAVEVKESAVVHVIRHLTPISSLIPLTYEFKLRNKACQGPVGRNSTHQPVSPTGLLQRTRWLAENRYAVAEPKDPVR